MLVITILVGANVGGRQRYVAALLDRAERLARERDNQARLAVAAERSRIARELHDVVAHGLSVMVRLADGAEAMFSTEPVRSREAIQKIGTVGRDSLRDMRLMLGVLDDDADASGSMEAASRVPEPPLTPQPGFAELDQLAEMFRGAGLPVALRRAGDRDVPATIQLVIYRTVQESLTNALRYADSPTRVLVSLDTDYDGVTVDISDDGTGTEPAPSVGTGRGLVGLRERALLFGGEFEAGPRSDHGGRGWRTTLRLPGAGDNR